MKQNRTGESVKVQQVYQTAYNAIVEPDKVFAVSRYYLDYWGPVLDPALWWLVVALQQAVGRSSVPGWCVIGQSDLAEEAGLRSRVQVGKRLSSRAAGWFIQEVKKRYVRDESGQARRATTAYRMYGDEPLVPRHAAGLRAIICRETGGRADAESLALLLNGLASMGQEPLIALLEEEEGPELKPAAFQALVTGAAGLGPQDVTPGVKGAVSSLHTAIVQPKSKVLEPQYFRRRWVQILKPALALVVLRLRSRCFYNPDTGELRDTCHLLREDLADAIGQSGRNLRRLLSDTNVELFFKEDEGEGNWWVQMVREPLTPEDAERCRLMEAEGQVYLPGGTKSNINPDDGGGEGTESNINPECGEGEERTESNINSGVGDEGRTESNINPGQNRTSNRTESSINPAGADRIEHQTGQNRTTYKVPKGLSFRESTEEQQQKAPADAAAFSSGGPEGKTNRGPETPDEAEEIAPRLNEPGLTTLAESDGWLAELQKAKRNRNRVSILGAMQRELLGEKPDRRRLQELAMTAGGDLDGALTVAQAILEVAVEGSGTLDDVEARLGNVETSKESPPAPATPQDDRAELRSALEEGGIWKSKIPGLLDLPHLTPLRARAWMLYAEQESGLDENPLGFAYNRMKDGSDPPCDFLLLAELDEGTRTLFLRGLDALDDGSGLLPIPEQLADPFIEFAGLRGYSPAEVRRELRLASDAREGSGVRPPPPRQRMTPAEKSWADAQSLLKGQMGQAAFDTYIRGIAPVSLENGTFVLAAPNPQAKEWLENRLHEVVTRTVCQVLGREVDVEFVVEEEG